MKHNFIIILYGPTGVGKTDFVDLLADALPHGLSIEVINGDMGQMYTSLSIGTAKPDLKSMKIPYHLFNSIDQPKDFTVIKYREQVEKIIGEIKERHNIPVIVGGSTFYLNALFFPPLPDGLISDKQEKKDFFSDGWEALYEIDPQRAREIKKDDHYRINRALEIWQSTGKKPSECVPVYNPVVPFYLICLMRDRNELYQRINDRVIKMLEEGWIDEVRLLQNTPWEDFIIRKKIIGYDDIQRYLKGEIDYDSMVSIIQKRTRNYAKRQITYWRMLERKLQKSLHDTNDTESNIEVVNLTHLDMQRYIKSLQKKLGLLCV